MSSIAFAELAYLVILGSVIGGLLIMRSRRQLSRLFHDAMLWGLIFVAVISLFGLREQLRFAIAPGQPYQTEESGIALTRHRDGHFYAILDINDVATKFLVDTGATAVVLSQETASRAGIELDTLIYSGTAITANGKIRTAPVRLDRIQLANRLERGFGAVVSDSDLATPLLGQSFLRLFDEVAIRGNIMTLR